jgi:hypothetical protein
MKDLETYDHLTSKELKREIDQTKKRISANAKEIELEVGSNIDKATQTAHQMICDVKSTLDISKIYNNNPWSFLLGSVVLGGILGRTFTNAAKPVSRSDGFVSHNEKTTARFGHDAAEIGFLDRIRNDYREELQELKNVATGVAIATLTNLARENLSPFVPDSIEKLTRSKNFGEKTTETYGQSHH